MGDKPFFSGFSGFAMSPAQESEKPEGEDLGCAWLFPKPVQALDVEDGAKPVVTFQLHFLGVKSEFTPEGFTVFFTGDEKYKLTVQGRNLRQVYDRLVEHRIRRIRRADRDFGSGKEPVITGIRIEEVKEEKRG